MRLWRAAAFATAVGALLVTSYVSADAPDRTFSNDGRFVADLAQGADDGAFDVAAAGDGKIIAAGFATRGSDDDFAVIRLNDDGRVDKTFSGDGDRFVGFGARGDDYARAAAIDQQGRIVLVGDTDTGGGVAIARLLPSGELDPRFSGDGRKTFGFGRNSNAGGASAVAIDHSGRIVVAGSSSSQAGIEPALARLRPNGELDPTFSHDGRLVLNSKLPGVSLSKAEACGVAIQRNGKIVIAVDGLLDQERTTLEVARFTVRGRPDDRFSADGRKTVSSAYAFHDGSPSVALSGHRILVSDSLSRHESIVARLTSSGKLDPRFSHDGRRAIPLANAADLASAGRKIVVIGTDKRSFAFARLKSRGRLDRSFGARGEKPIAFGDRPAKGFGLAVQADGKIVGAGEVGAGPSGIDFALARLRRR